MKNVFTSIAAAMLVIWYSLSVIGFDVHTCSGSGEIYVATVITGTACEDIHPEHELSVCQCGHHRHHHHAGEDNVRTKSCCTDQWQVIVLTGVPTDDSDVSLAECCPVSDMLCNAACCGLDASLADYMTLKANHRYKPRPGLLPFRDFQSVYNIWRI